MTSTAHHRLRVEHLRKRYRTRTVVDDVSFQVASGEVVGLLGPNGAGKTTSFYMTIGLVQSDGGMVYLDDRDLTQAPMHVRARMGIGYLPQEPSVFRRLTVAENILAVLEIRRELSRAQRMERLSHLLGELQIESLSRRRGDSLSGGERRRVEIARALASAPRFMLLDEPFAGVDPISIGGIQRIIKYLSDSEIGVLVTDHNVAATLGICCRAYIVDEGRIIATGSPEEVLADGRVRDAYLGSDFKL